MVAECDSGNLGWMVSGVFRRYSVIPRVVECAIRRDVARVADGDLPRCS